MPPCCWRAGSPASACGPPAVRPAVTGGCGWQRPYPCGRAGGGGQAGGDPARARRERYLCPAADLACTPAPVSRRQAQAVTADAMAGPRKASRRVLPVPDGQSGVRGRSVAAGRRSPRARPAWPPRPAVPGRASTPVMTPSSIIPAARHAERRHQGADGSQAPLPCQLPRNVSDTDDPAAAESAPPTIYSSRRGRWLPPRRTDPPVRRHHPCSVAAVRNSGLRLVKRCARRGRG